MIMVFQGGLPDNGEIINFEIEEEPKWVKVKLEDGSVELMLQSYNSMDD